MTVDVRRAVAKSVTKPVPQQYATPSGVKPQVAPMPKPPAEITAQIGSPISKASLVAAARVPDVALRVYPAPALSIERSSKVATPLTAPPRQRPRQRASTRVVAEGQRHYIGRVRYGVSECIP